MTRATLLRVLLAVALATTTACGESQAQRVCTSNVCPEGPAGPGPRSLGEGGSSSNNNTGWYILGGVAAAVIGWAITTRMFPDPPGPGGPPPSRPSSPD